VTISWQRYKAESIAALDSPVFSQWLMGAWYQTVQPLRHRIGLHHWRRIRIDLPGFDQCDWCGKKQPAAE
jgi:hypothetical protein